MKFTTYQNLLSAANPNEAADSVIEIIEATQDTKGLAKHDLPLIGQCNLSDDRKKTSATPFEAHFLVLDVDKMPAGAASVRDWLLSVPFEAAAHTTSSHVDGVTECWRIFIALAEPITDRTEYRNAATQIIATSPFLKYVDRTCTQIERFYFVAPVGARMLSNGITAGYTPTQPQKCNSVDSTKPQSHVEVSLTPENIETLIDAVKPELFEERHEWLKFIYSATHAGREVGMDDETITEILDNASAKNLGKYDAKKEKLMIAKLVIDAEPGKGVNATYLFKLVRESTGQTYHEYLFGKSDVVISENWGKTTTAESVYTKVMNTIRAGGRFNGSWHGKFKNGSNQEYTVSEGVYDALDIGNKVHMDVLTEAFYHEEKGYFETKSEYLRYIVNALNNFPYEVEDKEGNMVTKYMPVSGRFARSITDNIKTSYQARVHRKLSEAWDHDARPGLAFTDGFLAADTLTMEDHSPANKVNSAGAYDFEWGQGQDTHAPMWEETLSRMVGDAEAMNWFETVIGLGLLGKAPVSVQRMIVFVGAAGTGKSALKSIIDGITPDNASCHLDFGIYKPSDRFGKADLRDKRFAFYEETPRNIKEQADALKAVITGENIMVEKKGRDGMMIRPVALHMCFTNHVPRWGSDDGMSRRIAIYEMDASQVIVNKNPNFVSNVLATERSQIVRRVVRKAIEFLHTSPDKTLELPASMQVSAKKIIDQSNYVHTFLESVLDPEALVIKDAWMSNVDLHKNFVTWKQNNKTNVFSDDLSRTQFLQQMKAYVDDLSDGWRDKKKHEGKSIMNAFNLRAIQNKIYGVQEPEVVDTTVEF